VCYYWPECCCHRCLFNSVFCTGYPKVSFNSVYELVNMDDGRLDIGMLSDRFLA
jgi:hypothetical protein